VESAPIDRSKPARALVSIAPPGVLYSLAALPASEEMRTVDQQNDGSDTRPRRLSTRPGLIWAFDMSSGQPRPIEDCDGEGTGFRWFHLNLAHQGTVEWINQLDALPEDVRDMMIAGDNHQRALVDRGVVGCVVHDFEREFEQTESSETGVLRFALTTRMMVTARLHPVRSPDIVRQKIASGRATIEEPGEALDLLITTIAEGISSELRQISADVQRSEDRFLEGRAPPTTRDLIHIRRALSRAHRMVDGLGSVLRRLEEDEEIPDDVLAVTEKLAQRFQSLDADALGVLRQLRQLRAEIDLSIDQRTNQNLYVLSIMTALMLPATFVTGLFGMNTGGLPWMQAPHGTLLATMLAFGAAGATYLFLRWMGFMRR